ncbi:amidohydrolase [Tissierella creatinophila]|uniref:5-methylthioadenosine/S-adenosylhomocysteine deaminase n=1 Tax=Tissierella creatinophila DSM 6911 TaxID=1123403 RepID=A0A1U7M8P6_TISCR|nr:amidohydrolase [Tissierella creatinophila]OLS03651.1 5-methylthioadenosine/S-adenosylhomocysteine deaminase [Tissierella creatinophila DSM 6911]
MNILIKDIDIIPVNRKDEILKSTNLYIQKGRISHIGNLREDIKVDKKIDGKNKLLMPGLINSHTHLGMSLLRNFADDMNLTDWLTKKIWPMEAKLNGEDIYWGSLLSMGEMIMTGTTSFCDMYFFMDEVGRALENSGMRGVLTRGIIEDPKNPKEKLNETKELYKKWNNSLNEKVKVMVAPHAPYTCSPEFLIKTIELSEELNTGIHIHLSETKKEVEDSFKLYGKSPIKHVYDLGMFNSHTIAAHCVHISDEDIDILMENNVYPVNNPASNLKLASGFAPVSKMLKKGIKVSLGTDGASSNNNLDMFKELNLASLVNKAVDLEPLSVPAIKAIEMATLNGAFALGLEKEVGSIEVGKKADMILIDMDKPHLYPKHNLVSAISYSVNGTDVDTVIIDGNIVMENRELKTLDMEKIKYMTEKRTKDLLNR